MNRNIIWRTAAATIILAAGFSSFERAAHAASGPSVSSGDTDFSAERRGNGGRGGAARAGRAKRTNVNVSNHSRTNVNVNKRTNVNVNAGHRTNVVVGGGRPVRGWGHRPYYGTVIGGVALGTMIGVAVAGTAPVAPAPNMCWFWTDSVYSQGYWDYCVQP